MRHYLVFCITVFLAAHQGYLEAVKNEVFPITPADLYLMTLCIVLAILCLDKEKP